MNNGSLTKRERELLFLICEEGISDREIGERLGTTAGTIKVYCSRLYAKVGCSVVRGENGAHGRSALMLWYWRRKLAEAEAAKVA